MLTTLGPDGSNEYTTISREGDLGYPGEMLQRAAFN